jgi:hypothetical protein
MTVIEDFRTTLQDEVVLWMNQQVYLDSDRLRGGNFFNQALAQALCESVCMVVFYIPPYFDADYMYCAREFKAMEWHESHRLQRLGIKGGGNGLIIPIVCRGWDAFPAEIKNRRQCYNFEPYYMEKRGISQHPKGKNEVKQIARYIFDRYQELQARGEEPCRVCSTFPMPDEDEVRPWLSKLMARADQLPANEFPRL